MAETEAGALLRTNSAEELRQRVAAWRRQGLRVGYVPTMGALHEGHLSLVRKARDLADRVVVSIFVNPTQFGPSEDLERYPQRPDEDAELLARAGCDLVFLPQVETVYPPGHVTWVEVQGPPAEGLEAEHRPVHFRGVTTVVCQLLSLVTPDLTVFGEKDAQQLAVVERMVRDLHLPVEIVSSPTIREKDGLALSSRNAYLGPEERQAATVLYRALEAGEELIGAGERSGQAVRERMHRTLGAEPLARMDYAEVVEADTFQALEIVQGRVVLAVAARIGSTRLIDNFRLEVD